MNNPFFCRFRWNHKQSKLWKDKQEDSRLSSEWQTFQGNAKIILLFCTLIILLLCGSKIGHKTGSETLQSNCILVEAVGRCSIDISPIQISYCILLFQNITSQTSTKHEPSFRSHYVNLKKILCQQWQIFHYLFLCSICRQG